MDINTFKVRIEQVAKYWQSEAAEAESRGNKMQALVAMMEDYMGKSYDLRNDIAFEEEWLVLARRSLKK